MPHRNQPSQESAKAEFLVLVAEDHAGYREVVCRALELYLPGARALEAGSVSEAVLTLRKSRPECLVTDLFLPDGSALDLLRQISAEKGGMRVVVFSNHSMEELAPLLEHAGVDAVLTKQEGLKALAAALKARNG